MRRVSTAIVSTTLAMAMSHMQPAMRAQDVSGRGQTGAESTQSDDASRRRFAVTLAIGDMEAGPSGTFTPAATKALADLKNFLPYKRYQPLDTIYRIGVNGPTQEMFCMDGKCEFHMTGQAISPVATNIALLQLREIPSPERKTTVILINTSLKITIGETVVVGTSRLDGKRGLLLLVTSAP